MNSLPDTDLTASGGVPARLRLFGTEERVRVLRADGTQVASSGWRTNTTWTRWLPRGRYVAQVAPRKGSMTGRFGVVTSFRVP